MTLLAHVRRSKTSVLIGAAMLVTFVQGCGAAPVSRTVSLRMSGDPKDALVVVDDQTVGSLDMVATRGVALPAGKHFLTIQKAGYFPFDKILEVSPGDPPVKLDVRLVRFPE